MTLIVFLTFPSPECNQFLCICFPLFVGEIVIFHFLTRSWLTCEMEVFFKLWYKWGYVRLHYYYLGCLYLKRILECKILWWFELGPVCASQWAYRYSRQSLQFWAPCLCIHTRSQQLVVYWWLLWIYTLCWAETQILKTYLWPWETYNLERISRKYLI